MAEVTAIDPIKLNIRRRQTISEENHVNRIHSSRSSDLFSNKKGSDSSQHISHDLYQNNENSRIPAESTKEFYKNKPMETLAEKERKSSISPNLDSVKRQSISQENHIKRIRSGNSRRLSERLPSKEIVNTQQNVNYDYNEELSKSYLSNKRISHVNCVPGKITKEDISNKSNQNLKANNHNVDIRRKSSFSANSEFPKKQNSSQNQTNDNDMHSGDASRKPCNSRKASTSRKRKSIRMGNEKTETNTSRKASTMKTRNETNSGRKVSQNPSASNSKTKIKQKIKTTSPKSKQSASIKNEQLKENSKQTNPPAKDDTINTDPKTAEISDSEKIFTSNCNGSLKDTIVIICVHKNNFPLNDKKRHASISPETKTPVLPHKKPPKNRMKEELPDNRKSTGMKQKSKSPTIKEEKSSITKPTEKSANKLLETQKSDVAPMTEITKKLSDVDLHISEQGNLQVIFDAKSISPEDAAIVIWLDNIPETLFAPDFGKRQHVAPKPNLEEAGHSFEIIESHSASELEDIPPAKPAIYFPPVTILENIAVDSKFGMRRLSKEFETSVYYKRCNLGHAEWEINGELSFQQSGKDISMK